MNCLHAAVTYSTTMRPARHEGAAVTLLSWNVASLRTSLKKANRTLR